MSILNDSDDTLFEDEKENASSNTPLSSTPTRKPSPISSVATQNVKSKEWKFEILELDEVQHDSPMFKERIKQVEEQMDDYILKLKRIAKITRQITTTSSALGKLQKQLGEELKGFTPTVSDTELEIAFDKFGNIFMELDHFREILAVQTEDLLSVPMENFIKQEIEEVREKKKKFERARSSFDAALSKASHMKKKNQNTMKVLEVEHELADTKMDFQIASLHYVFSLNELQSHKKLEALERICSSMYSQVSYFHSGYELLHELEVYLGKLSSHVQGVRSGFDSEKANAEIRMRDFEQSSSKSTSQKPSRTQSKTIQGYLFKRNNGLTKDWQRRYFVIEEGVIKYYKNNKDTVPTTDINLLLCTVKVKEDIDRRFCFEVISPDKTYLLQADNEEKMIEWITVIQNATADLLNSQDVTRKSAYTASPPDPRKDTEDSSQPKILSLLRESNEHNCYCADCGVKDPDWASINLGVLICINCSGIHRNLGVHISKVRSFTLDKWEPDLIKLMESLGNEKVNNIYEYSIPSDVKKPDSGTDRFSRESFIKMKYQEKKFKKVESISISELNQKLYSAAKEGDVAMILKTLVSGADINYQNELEEKKAPLHIAVIDGQVISVMMLCQNRANVNIIDSKGWTPIHYATFHGRVNSSAILFKNGAKLDIPDNSGELPIDIAVKNQVADSVTFIRLAQLAISENTTDDSFMEALESFSQEVSSQSKG